MQIMERWTSCANFGALLISFMTVQLSISEVLEFGNFPVISSNGLRTSATENLAIILVKFSLVNGTLREYRISTSTARQPTRLQIWRPDISQENVYTLVDDTRIQTTITGNFSVIPVSRVDVQTGDKFGFYCQSGVTAIAYDFLPHADGSKIILTPFEAADRGPATSVAYSFQQEIYATWVFGMSVVIDTEGGTGPWAGEGPRPSVGPPLKPSPGLYIGNPSIDGEVLDTVKGMVFLMVGFPLPAADLSSFVLHAAEPGRIVALQVWRRINPHGGETTPSESGNFTLKYQVLHTTTRHGDEEVSLAQRWPVQQGDLLGYYNYQNMNAITHTPMSSSSTILRTLYADTSYNMAPLPGNIYHFPNQSDFLKFSLAATFFIDSTTVGPTKTPVAEGSSEPKRLWYLLLIPVCMAVVSLCVSIYACFYIGNDKGKVHNNMSRRPEAACRYNHATTEDSFSTGSIADVYVIDGPEPNQPTHSDNLKLGALRGNWNEHGSSEVPRVN